MEIDYLGWILFWLIDYLGWNVVKFSVLYPPEDMFCSVPADTLAQKNRSTVEQSSTSSIVKSFKEAPGADFAL